MTIPAIASLLVALVPAGARVHSPAPPPTVRPPLVTAAGLPELPVAPWGPYARTSLAPAYVADRVSGKVMEFPIVVGQVRHEIVPARQGVPAHRVRLERRATGLADLAASGDDTEPRGDAPALSRHFVVEDANPDGTFFRLGAEFEVAGLRPQDAAATLPAGTTGADEDWGRGIVTVEWFPAYADPDIDGVVVRVTVLNTTTSTEEWYVDMLGGMRAAGSGFAPQGMVADTSPSGFVTGHKSLATYFDAEAARGNYDIQTAIVGREYFAQLPSTRGGDQIGPRGVLPGSTPATEPRWALCRAGNLVLGPGEQADVVYAIGTGTGSDDAHRSALALLRGAGSAPGGLPARAAAEQREQRLAIASPEIARLAAQSFANVPFDDLRRVGVPSRAQLDSGHGEMYAPEAGGWIALGWSAWRPDWAAAQANAWFISERPDSVRYGDYALVPTNAFALWSLYQRTGDVALVRKLLPSAAGRFLGAVHAMGGATASAFQWPAGSGDLHGPSTGPPPRGASPACAAIVDREARILHALGDVAAQPVPPGVDAALAAAQRQLGGEAGSPSTAEWLLPLIAGGQAGAAAATADRIASISQGGRFRARAGIRTAAAGSPGYAHTDRASGGVDFGLTWLVWMSLLNEGHGDLAGSLASDTITGYEHAHGLCGGCPEYLDGDTCMGAGAMDAGGAACALLDIYAAYHIPGAMTPGWDTRVAARSWSSTEDRLTATLVRMDANLGASVVCVMGAANTTYACTGAVPALARSDAHGALTIRLPAGVGAHAVTIARVPSAR